MSQINHERRKRTKGREQKLELFCRSVKLVFFFFYYFEHRLVVPLKMDFLLFLFIFIYK